MPQEIITLATYLNIPQLIAVAIMFWFFYERIDGKIEKLEEKINQRFDKVDQRFERVDQRFERVDQRFERVEEKLNNLDKRLCRLEGAFSSKECCYFKEHSHQKVD